MLALTSHPSMRLPSLMERRAHRLADCLNKYALKAGARGRVTTSDALNLLMNRPFDCPFCNRHFPITRAGARFVFPLGMGRVGRCTPSNISICCAECGSVCRV